MQRIVKVLVAIAALGSVAYYGIINSLSSEPLTTALGTISTAKVDLPDSPDEWRGKVDYRTFDAQLAELSARPEMAGLTVAVVENGKLTFVRSYGVSDRATDTPVTLETVFRWASVSKTVAGTVAATLAVEGALDLERPVASWNGTLRLPDGAQSKVTLSQLLAHQTGLTKNAYDERLEDGEDPVVVRAELAAAPLQCLPGTCHTYQNVAFDAASEILSKASNRPYPALVSERLFLPLGMTSADFGMTGLTGAKDWARPHNGREVRTLRETYWRVPAAAGVSSNIVDFAKWMQAAMGERPDVLPVSVLRLAQKPRVKTQRLYSGDLRQANSDPGYGLGWRSFLYGKHRLVGHSGAVDGFRTTMIFEPKTGNGVVAMWNSNWGRPFRIPFAVFDSYDKIPDTHWLDPGDLPTR